MHASSEVGTGRTFMRGAWAITAALALLSTPARAQQVPPNAPAAPGAPGAPTPAAAGAGVPSPYTGPVAAPPAGPENPFGRKYQPRVYTTQRLIAKPPVVDGRLDDEAWQDAGRVGRELHAEHADGGRAPDGADRAQGPLRRQEPLLRDPRVRRSRQDPRAPRPPRRLRRVRDRRRRYLLRQLQRQAHGLRVRPHRRRGKDRPHPRQRRAGVGHHLGRRLGRQGRARRKGLDGGVPRSPQPAAVRQAEGAGLGHARVALAHPQQGGEPVAAHPAPEHREDVPARRVARDPRPAARHGTSSCCRTWSARRPPARRCPATARTAPGRSASTRRSV